MIGTERDSLLRRFEQALDHAEAQVQRLISVHPDRLPAYTHHGIWQASDERFLDGQATLLPAIMMRFAMRRDPDAAKAAQWRERAEHYSKLVLGHLERGGVYPAGLALFCGPVRFWHERTKEETQTEGLPEKMTDLAHQIAANFHELGSYLHAPQVIDCVRIESLIDAASLIYVGRLVGNEDLMELGSQHCATVRRYLVRGDGSTASGGRFDPQTGEFVQAIRHGGHRSDSCCSRGQAWAIYGFSVCGRMLEFSPWLETARHCSYFMMERIAADILPVWDFDAPPDRRTGRDSAASAIAAAGLFELADAEQTVGTEQARIRRYLKDASLRLLTGLCEPTVLSINDPAWEGILKQSIARFDVPSASNESTMLGDFFFVEALCTAIEYLQTSRA
jgi:unsaturated chondroitin disaccharide hydrolase